MQDKHEYRECMTHRNKHLGFDKVTQIIHAHNWELTASSTVALLLVRFERVTLAP